MEGYEVIKPRHFSSVPRRRFGVATRPLGAEVLVSAVSQEHIFLDKKKVYGYLRQLHPYPEIRGRAMDEINNADVALFDIYRIPKHGHYPVGLEGVVYDLPSEIEKQTPLSLELVGKGKEIIIECWPPSYPKINLPEEEISAAEQRRLLQESGPPQSDDEDILADLLPDAQELIPSPMSAHEDQDDSLLSSPIKGEKEKKSSVLADLVQSTVILDLDSQSQGHLQSHSQPLSQPLSQQPQPRSISSSFTTPSFNTSLKLGDLLDQLHDESTVPDEDVEVFDGPEVHAPLKVDVLVPPTDVALPPLCTEEFVLPVTPIDGAVAFTPRLFEVKNNGAIRFLIVSRKRGLETWSIPPWSVSSQVINEVQNECYNEDSPCLSAFQWANQWKGSGLVSLFSSIKFINFLKIFRQKVAGIHLEDFPDLDFNTYPKDLLPSTEVKILLKSNLKNFQPKHIPVALFSKNPGLSGSLRLRSVRPVVSEVNAGARSKKGELKTDWKIVTLKGNSKFFESLKGFPEAYPFFLAGGHVHIRGGSGRVKGFPPKGRGTILSTASSSSSSSFSSVVVSDVSQDSVVIDASEMDSLLSGFEPGGSSTISPSPRPVVSASRFPMGAGEDQAQDQDHSQSSQVVKSSSKSKPKNRGRGFTRGKSTPSKKVAPVKGKGTLRK